MAQDTRYYAARKAAEQAEKERKRQEADSQIQAAQRERLLAEPRRAFLAAGGTTEMWAEQEDSIFADILREQAIRAGTTSAAPVFSRTSF